MSIGKFVCVPLSLGLLFSSSAYALENCVTPPSCEELGFTVNVEDCDGSSLKCPWDLSKAACKKKTPKTPSLILYGDGTVTKEILADKTPVGIVFDEENQLALALTDVKRTSVGSQTLYWDMGFGYDIPSLENCQYNDGDPAVDSCNVDGRVNTDVILSCGNGCTKTQAANAANEYNPRGCTADFCKQNQWFLPSMRDLANIYANKSEINASLTLLNSSGAEVLSEWDRSGGVYEYYWSSVEYDKKQAWCFGMSQGERDHTLKANPYDYTNTSPYYVRPVVYYGEPRQQASMPILYGDGTVTKYILNDKTPIGIVFDEENRLAVALTDVNSSGAAGSSTMYWSSSYCDVPSLTNCVYSDGDTAVDSCSVDGRANTDAILASTCNGTTYAANGANLYNPSGCAADFCKKNKWFLPSMRDLAKIYANKSVINASLSLLSSFGAKTLTESYYWSSTERNDAGAWDFDMNIGFRYWFNKNYGNLYVRPVVKY